jgi:energy-coupling factor transporter ATP-binding protein EcfA2
VLVIANFPANFSEMAAQRLRSIVASGARCGVFVLLSVDMKLPLPRHFNLSDLESNSLVLGWKNGQFLWQHPEYGPLALTLDSPPRAERFTEIVRTVGSQVKDAGRVEVPFHCVVPAEGEWWTADSRAGIDVPLGRAGAMKLQHLDLGKGTSQHVLISGKTGSGKSTLLHVLITNMATRYSPDQVELYLVDFKKGVEFKAYARYELPHARVIAIESEREFGLSVLQRLDAELRTRGDLFRRLGVQDLKSYRNLSGASAEPANSDAAGSGRMDFPVRPSVPDEPGNPSYGKGDAGPAAGGNRPVLPRILLIIDEFQELFVEDDRIAQEAALLLDRLVRQGRAFGIHVLLGSQTLGGAYSLARSTIGQMAVRIALQCSESDAHLILSEDNTAARLLTRPGEAIYNDANGLYEGNHPFQIVWLSDDDRDDYLHRVRKLAAERSRRSAPAIVFEGNVLADPGDNPAVRTLLAADTWPSACPSPLAWLGSAVAIKEPTAATFVRQAGSNLLLVGHREEASIGVMSSCLLSLALQHAPGGPGDGAVGARMVVLDGTRPDAPEAGFWRYFAPALPHGVRVAEVRETPQIMTELAQEIALRQQDGQGQHAPIYLFIYNLSRFRDLRKEEDFGFGGMDDSRPASPGKQFGTLLREGPALGIHTIAWCDSYGTFSRLLDRQSLRDFDMRVLFQMSATDSSSLMDSAEAGRLGVHRAIFYDEGQGSIEKFRPYGPPPNAWLAQVRERLHARCERADSAPVT